MQALTMLGKALAGLFWLAFGAALAKWLGSPFEQLLYLLAALLLVIHGLELWLFAGLLKGRANPWQDRVQILLFGVFHLLSLKPATPVQEPAELNCDEVAHA
jgi:putative membrane protein